MTDNKIYEVVLELLIHIVPEISLIVFKYRFGIRYRCNVF